MRGPELLARTMSIPTVKGKDGQKYQYHSRSDSHSKLACWCVLYDALMQCDIIREHARRGLLGFGINYEMVGPISKTLDLVLTRVPPARKAKNRLSFLELGDKFGVNLDASDRRELSKHPLLFQDDAADDSEVVVALEAKACMTKHLGSLPRLHAEILATGYLAKRAMPRCIAVSFTLVNAAKNFTASSAAQSTNVHRQPEDAQRVLEMLGQAVPLARDINNLVGYDAIGALVIECSNDGSKVTVPPSFDWPKEAKHLQYPRMIRQLCSEYRARAGK